MSPRQRRKRYARSVSKSQRLAIFAIDHSQCVYCGASHDLTLDHVIPVAELLGHVPKYLINSKSNLVTACRTCNVVVKNTVQPDLPFKYGRYAQC